MQETKQQKNINGIILMLINTFATAMLYIAAKYLTNFISSNQVVFFYKSLVLVGILPWILYEGLDCIKTKKLKLHLLRGFFSTSGALCFFYGLSKVDIASATALNKMEPILLMIASALYFKEKLSLLKIFTVITSFLGMLFVVFPIITFNESNNLTFIWQNFNQISNLNYHYLIIILAVLLWTMNSSVIKNLGKTESNRTQLFYISVISVLISMPTAIFSWNMENFIGFQVPWISGISSFEGLTVQAIGILLCLGMLHFMHVSCYFQSLKVADMSVVIPFDYSRMVFAGVLGFCFFNTLPTLSQYVGYSLILVSGVFLIKAQHKISKKIR